jgi:hypothetical protein
MFFFGPLYCLFFWNNKFKQWTMGRIVFEWSLSITSRTMLPSIHDVSYFHLYLNTSKCRSFYHFKEISIFRNGEHIEWRAGLSYILLKGDAHNDNPCKKAKNKSKKIKTNILTIYYWSVLAKVFVYLGVCVEWVGSLCYTHVCLSGNWFPLNKLCSYWANLLKLFKRNAGICT